MPISPMTSIFHPGPPLVGRSGELAELRSAFDAPGPGLIVVTGPRARGKTALLTQALAGREALHFQAADLTERDLLGDLTRLAESVLGEIPQPRRPGVLPLASGAGGWLSLLMGLADRLDQAGRPMVLVLDGVEALVTARRRLKDDLVEMFASVRTRALPLKLVLVARQENALAPLLDEDSGLGSPALTLSLAGLPFRVAGWGHGGRNPRDAFLRWAILGDHPAHLPRGSRESELDETVSARVLTPGGDLFEAPLRRLEITFLRPARYAAILRALARGPLDWSGLLAEAKGIDSGGQLAPYLRRLEEEGWVRADLPLEARPGSRSRRYSLADPFDAFWFGWVLPIRSLLPTLGGPESWRALIRPHLEDHFQGWMEEAGRRWLREHAGTGLGAPAREGGALWGEEADFPVAGRLANGQVCFGLVDWPMAKRDLPGEMARRMRETRYGLGREARAPLFFIGGEADEGLRRMEAREPLARVIDLNQLMGPGPEEEA